MAKLSKKQKKKIASKLGLQEKELDEVIQDLQEMDILRHVSEKVWEVFDGIRWHEVRL